MKNTINGKVWTGSHLLDLMDPVSPKAERLAEDWFPLFRTVDPGNIAHRFLDTPSEIQGVARAAA